jgi:hypothetical protein
VFGNRNLRILRLPGENHFPFTPWSLCESLVSETQNML